MNRLLISLVLALLSACGGGGPTDQEAVRLLLDQGGECYAVAAGRSGPDKFNAVAADIASTAQSAVCAAWPTGMAVSCADAYALYSRPFSGKCL